MKSLNNCLPAHFSQKLHIIQQLNETLIDCLPVEYLSHVQVTGIEKTTLTLAVDSPVWASKLRYLSRELSKQFATKTGLKIQSVKLSIQPPSSAPLKKRRKKPYLSKSSASQCKTLANSIDDPGLKRALLKLSRRSKP